MRHKLFFQLPVFFKWNFTALIVPTDFNFYSGPVQIHFDVNLLQDETH